jgi:hypothetical protein
LCRVWARLARSPIEKYQRRSDPAAPERVFGRSKMRPALGRLSPRQQRRLSSNHHLTP